MGYGQFQTTGTIASGASTSGGIDLQCHRGTVFVYVGTMSTAAAITVQDSPNGGTSYYNMFQIANSAATQANAYNIASGVGANGGVVRIDGARYLRFIASAVVSGGVAFTVVAND